MAHMAAPLSVDSLTEPVPSNASSSGQKRMCPLEFSGKGFGCDQMKEFGGPSDSIDYS